MPAHALGRTASMRRKIFYLARFLFAQWVRCGEKCRIDLGKKGRARNFRFSSVSAVVGESPPPKKKRRSNGARESFSGTSWENQHTPGGILPGFSLSIICRN